MHFGGQYSNEFDQSEKWAEIKEVKLSNDKCEALHLGRKKSNGQMQNWE